ncbi:guanine nucleotide exchange factor [Anaeramoeba flamelloides]|uniref:Guanine nucleotide exchange factor n=1 Tax=Anaeramoeba flamelloides TaxID=1746091 RepID=A0AAV7ZQ37_9EUKA|nr:guanine nucleotide exchange factor [Anaeramoeba flamelloides]
MIFYPFEKNSNIKEQKETKKPFHRTHSAISLITFFAQVLESDENKEESLNKPQEKKLKIKNNDEKKNKKLTKQLKSFERTYSTNSQAEISSFRIPKHEKKTSIHVGLEKVREKRATILKKRSRERIGKKKQVTPLKEQISEKKINNLFLDKDLYFTRVSTTVSSKEELTKIEKEGEKEKEKEEEEEEHKKEKETKTDNDTKNYTEDEKKPEPEQETKVETQPKDLEKEKVKDQKTETNLENEQCFLELKAAIKCVQQMIEKEEKTKKGLKVIISCYDKNDKSSIKAIDYITQSTKSVHLLEIFLKQLFYNYLNLKINLKKDLNTYAIATNETRYASHRKLLSFKKFDLIKVIKAGKSTNKRNWIGEVNGIKGLFGAADVHLPEIIDDEYVEYNKKKKPPVSIIPKNINWKYFTIFEIEPKEVARQITIKEFGAYKKIQFSELLKQSWNKKNRWWRAKNVRNMIQRFNELSFWICTMILITEKLEDRITVVEYFLDLAKCLRKLNNFNCLMAVISALRSIPIQRLTFTFEELGDRHEKILTQIDEIFNSEHAFKNYRKALNEAFDNQKPLIPFLGIHLTDLTFLDDTAEDLDKNGELSLEKMETMSKAIMHILQYQTREYQLKPVFKLQHYFKVYPAMDSESLYNMSLKREPRGCDYEDLD